MKEAAKRTGLDYGCCNAGREGVARIRETTRGDFEALAEAMGLPAVTADELFKGELLDWRFEDPSRRSDYFITRAPSGKSATRWIKFTVTDAVVPV